MSRPEGFGEPQGGAPMGRHVLVARQDSIGDVLLAGPAVRAVAAGADRVTLLCGPRGRAACPGRPVVPAAAAAAASEAEPDELLNDIMAELGGEPGPGSSLEDSLGLPLGDSYTEDFFGDEEPEDEQPAAEEEGDVLEDTPDFLQETPEHDRLWFEQKPPRDFDFD